MADKSEIEWTDASWQVSGGCTRVSPGCKYCYAERLVGTRQRHLPRTQGLTVVRGDGKPHWTNEVRLYEDNLTQPLRWKRPRRIFVNSLSDLFHKDVPFEFIDRVFAVMALCPQHTFQVLTKRPERMTGYSGGLHERIRTDADAAAFMLNALPGRMISIAEFRRLLRPLPNVWLGTSVENQAAADERIPALLRCPAAVRFLSCEPLLGPVDLNYAFGDPRGAGKGSCPMHLAGVCPEGLLPAGKHPLHWVIVGGESGPGARPMHPDWARGLRDQCVAAGVPFFFKQHGEYVPSIGAEAVGDLQFRSDGVVTGRVTEVCYATHPKVKEARQAAAREIGGANEFGVPITEIPVGVSTGITVPHDERLGRYTVIRRVGKAAAGRLLDGRTWDEFPQEATNGV